MALEEEYAIVPQTQLSPIARLAEIKLLREVECAILLQVLALATVHLVQMWQKVAVVMEAECSTI